MDTILVTGGKYRGRKIATPGGATHPMGSRERLALFNMLAGLIEGAVVLDAFSGSGALGIEALSRGATRVVFIDSSINASRVIKDNLTNLGVGNNDFEVIKSSVSKAAENLSDFSVVLADPPYDDFDLNEIKPLARLVRDGGVLALSHPTEAPELPGLRLEKTRVYAGAHISIYQK